MGIQALRPHLLGKRDVVDLTFGVCENQGPCPYDSPCCGTEVESVQAHIDSHDLQLGLCGFVRVRMFQERL